MAVSEPLDALDWVLGAGWPLVDCRTDDDVRGSPFFYPRRVLPVQCTIDAVVAIFAQNHSWPLVGLRFTNQHPSLHASQGGQCNGVDTCGLIGRTSLCTNDACTGGTGPGGGFMFPHMINASSRPYDGLSVEDTEAQFTTRYDQAFSTNMYDPFLDYSLVLYAKSLDKWINSTVEWVESKETRLAASHSPLSPSLQAGSNSSSVKPYMALSWTDNTDAQWYSVIMHVPNTQVTIELVSETKPTVVTDDDLIADPLMRYPATGSCSYNGCSNATDNYWVPLAVSKVRLMFSCLPPPPPLPPHCLVRPLTFPPRVSLMLMRSARGT